MENFVVSARKYRPQNFETVVGQSHITTTLKNAVKNNQLAHAFLFCGPRGVGKTTCARILAKTINCENRTGDGEACNVCNSCLSFDNGTSLNIHELDAASNNSVDDIRALVDQVRFAPQAGKYKVYIVDEVHMLSAAAFNAFLKTLEEPPPFAIFILATTEKHKILPTILSRCQIFDFKRITNQDTSDHLKEICIKENISTEPAALHLIAQKSEGCLRDALSILDKIASFTNANITYANTLEHLNILDEDYYFQMIAAMQSQQISEALTLYDEINKKGFEGDELLNGLSEFVRNLLVSQQPGIANLLEVSEAFKEKYFTVSKSIDSSWLLSALNILSEAEINIRQAKNKKLHVELVLIKLCYLKQALQIVESGGDVIEKKMMSEAKPVAFRSLTPVAFKERELKNTNQATPKNPESIGKKNNQYSSEAMLVVESEVLNIAKEKLPADHTYVKKNIDKVSKIGSLKQIREKLALENKNNETKDLTRDEIYIAWEIYISDLVKKCHHAKVTHFKNAVLEIAEDNCIEITVDNKLQQKFIEAERGELINFLQLHFNNRYIIYRVFINKASKAKDEKKEEYLNSTQKYLKLVEQYPFVKKMKDSLGLHLEY
ncbi:MAG: DNA polymerase III subunit gamma/tau [Ginsengibacter sp.]